MIFQEFSDSQSWYSGAVLFSEEVWLLETATLQLCSEAALEISSSAKSNIYSMKECVSYFCNTKFLKIFTLS